jgi:hypothetical protein
MVASEKIAIWEEHMLKAENFNGSNIRYCQEVGISKSQFSYWKNRLKELKEKSSIIPEQKISNFIPVEIRPTPALKKASLPEAKWVAEFLVYFMNASK